MLTLRLIGDEYLHYNVTDDGYSVVSNGKGSYVYARMGADGQLAPTTLVAHDAGERQSAETSYLQQVDKYLTPRMTAERAHEQQAEQARREAQLAQRVFLGRDDPLIEHSDPLAYSLAAILYPLIICQQPVFIIHSKNR